MEKLSITLTSAQKAFIDAEVASGRYASTSEVLRQSINKRMQEQAFLDLLADRHDAAVREYRAGELLSHEDVFGEILGCTQDAA